MPREFDNFTIQAIREFESMTGTEVRDCLINEYIYFLVNPGKAALAIGKGGQAVKSAEADMNKQIKIYEWNEDVQHFIKNLIPCAQKIVLNGGGATVTIPSKEKGSIIGKGGSNIKALRELVLRNSDLKDLRVV